METNTRITLVQFTNPNEPDYVVKINRVYTDDRCVYIVIESSDDHEVSHHYDDPKVAWEAFHQITSCHFNQAFSA